MKEEEQPNKKLKQKTCLIFFAPIGAGKSTFIENILKKTNHLDVYSNDSVDIKDKKTLKLLKRFYEKIAVLQAGEFTQWYNVDKLFESIDKTAMSLQLNLSNNFNNLIYNLDKKAKLKNKELIILDTCPLSSIAFVRTQKQLGIITEKNADYIESILKKQQDDLLKLLNDNGFRIIFIVINDIFDSLVRKYITNCRLLKNIYELPFYYIQRERGIEYHPLKDYLSGLFYHFKCLHQEYFCGLNKYIENSFTCKYGTDFHIDNTYIQNKTDREKNIEIILNTLMKIITEY